MIALWDLGNVVVQWNPDKILRMIDLPPDKAEPVRALLQGGKLWLDLDRGVTDEETVAATIAAQSGLEKTELFRCFDIVRESLVDFEASIALLHEMKSAGIPLYVLSNMSQVNAAFLRQRPYFKLFDGVVISAEEKLIKPDPALFQVVLDRYHLAAEEIVFIDDGELNIKAAQSLGMHGVHFKATDECYASVRGYFPELS